MEINTDIFRREIERIVSATIQKYVANYLDTSYFGTVTSVDADGVDVRPEVDLGFTKLRVKDLSGVEIAIGDKVIVKAHGNKFNNAYIDKKFS